MDESEVYMLAISTATILISILYILRYLIYVDTITVSIAITNVTNLIDITLTYYITFCYIFLHYTYYCYY